MMRGLLGRKIGMTQKFDSDGNLIPVTILKAGPCFVTQLKTNNTDGYFSVQVGFEDSSGKHTNNPMSKASEYNKIKIYLRVPLYNH